MVSSSVLSHPGASPVALKDSAGSASTPPSGILRARARIRPMSTAQKKLPRMASAGVAVRLPGAVGSGAASDCAAGTGSDHAFLPHHSR